MVAANRKYRWWWRWQRHDAGYISWTISTVRKESPQHHRILHILWITHQITTTEKSHDNLNTMRWHVRSGKKRCSIAPAYIRSIRVVRFFFSIPELWPRFRAFPVIFLFWIGLNHPFKEFDTKQFACRQYLVSVVSRLGLAEERAGFQGRF